jgi:hypothetical protein
MSDHIIEFRKKVYEHLRNVNSVDKLMRDKLEPYILLDELPCPIQIGTKTIFVGNLNLNNEDYFFKGWAKILGNLGMQNMFIDLLSNGLELMKYMKIHTALRKDLTDLVAKTLLKQQKFYYPNNQKEYKLNKCSMRYFKNYMNKEKLIQVVFLLYTYNYDSSKKSLALVVNRMGAGAMSETFMYNWLENCPGVNGNFLLSQLPNLEWFNNESLKSKDEVKHIEENES